MTEFAQLRIPALPQRNFVKREGNASQITVQFRRGDSPTSEAANDVRRDLERDNDSDVGHSREPSAGRWRQKTTETLRRQKPTREQRQKSVAHILQLHLAKIAKSRQTRSGFDHQMRTPVNFLNESEEG